MTTSIMMCTYNRLDLTRRMLDSFFRTTTSPYRLIIVDNGSSDGTPDYLSSLTPPKEWCQSYDTIFNLENKGIATGRNQGLKLAAQYKTDFLSTLDNDVEMPNNWLHECIDIITANPNFSIGVNMEDVAYPLKMINGKTFQVKSAGNLGSACMVFPRRLHAQIGYFTTEYAKYGEEDANWGYRTRLVGWQLGYIQTKGGHFGVGEFDTGTYRAFKDACRTQNIAQFRRDCTLLASGQKSYYLPYTEKA